MNRQELIGNWNEVKGRIRERWGQLTNDDLEQTGGKLDSLVGMIQRKTGEQQDQIKKFIDDLGDSSGSTMEKARQGLESMRSNVAEKSHEFSESAHEQYEQIAAQLKTQYDQAAAQLQQQYENARTTVRNNPLESVAVALGAGLITGVVLGLVLRSNHR